MLANTTYFQNKAIFRRAINALVDLSVEENQLLTELRPNAVAVTPALSKALNTRIQQFAEPDQALFTNSLETRLYLQNWFLKLFQYREETSTKSYPDLAPIHLNILLISVDLILAYGHEIAQNSSNPEAAYKAFQKALALKISSEQMQIQADESQHFYEMMLLD
jgi:hypothetical protein